MNLKRIYLSRLKSKKLRSFIIVLILISIAVITTMWSSPSKYSLTKVGASSYMLTLLAYDNNESQLNSTTFFEVIRWSQHIATMNDSVAMGHPWIANNGSLPAISWESPTPVRISVFWETPTVGYSTVYLDNEGSGFNSSDTINFNWEVAKTQWRLLSDAYESRVNNTELVYDPRSSFTMLRTYADENLTQAASSVDDNIKANFSNQALDYVIQAYELMLREYGLQYGRRYYEPSEYWLGVTIDSLANYQVVLDKVKNLGNDWIRIVFDRNPDDFIYSNSTSFWFDAAIDYANSIELNVMGEILDSYYWAETPNMTVGMYENRTANLVNHYLGKIQVWEVGNEINGYWLNNPDDVIVNSINAAAQRIKQIDPDLKTVTTLFWCEGAMGEHVDYSLLSWLNRWKGQGAYGGFGTNIDAISLSVYINYNPVGSAFDTIINRLHKYFPDKKIMLGEFDYIEYNPAEHYWWHSTNLTVLREELLEHFYISMFGYEYSLVGGFWWSFLDEMVDSSDNYNETSLYWAYYDLIRLVKAPNIILNAPPNYSNFTQANLDIVLNATVMDADNDEMRVEFFAGDIPGISGAHGLVYQESDVPSGSTLTYNLNALSVTPDPSTSLLFHFDNRSEYRENETHVYDFSGNGNNGTVYGNAVFEQTAGKFAGAFKYDMLDDYVEVSHKPKFNSPNRSAEAWIRPGLEAHIGYIIGREGWGINESYLSIEYSWGYIHARVGNRSSQPTVTYQLPPEARVNVWHHVAATYDNQTLRLYVDGQERGNATIVNGVNDLIRPWRVAVAPTWQGDFFNGAIDEVAVYNRVLSPEEIEDRYRLKEGTYYWHVIASDGINEAQSETRQFFVDSRLYSVRLTHPGHKITNVTTNATYNITVTNDGNVSDNITLSMNNADGASIAELSQYSIANLEPNSSVNVTLTVGDAEPGKYVVIVTAASEEILGSEDSVSITTNVILDTFVLGTYLICEQWQSLGNYTAGVEKIKEIGGSAVLLSAGSGDALWPSDYLPKPNWMPDDHLKEVIDYSHSQGLKVYAWFGMPNAYWLNESRHPEWIQILSNGTPADYWPIVPPSRVLGTPEYLDQLKGLIGELVELGFDGIDLNDDFQFLYDASFDNFTVNKFENETNVSVLGSTIPERAQFIKDNQTLLDMWYIWRASQVTELLGLLQQYIRDAGSDIPLRPHLMSHQWVYWDCGYDWDGIAGAVDVPYLMLGFGEEGIKNAIGWLKDAGAKRIATSLYLDTIDIGEEDWLAQNLEWVKDAGAREVFLFNWILAENKGLWQTIRAAVDIANEGSIPNITIDQPQYGTSPTYVTPLTELNLSSEDFDNGSALIWYRIDGGRWTIYTGNFTMSSAGHHTIYYYGSSYIGLDVHIKSYNIFVDIDEPVSTLNVGQPKWGTSPTYITSSTEFNLTAEDGDAGVASIWYRIDIGTWVQYSGNFTVNSVESHTISYYAIDNLGNNETIQLYDIFVDDYAPMVYVLPWNISSGTIEIERGQNITLRSSDLGVGNEIIYYSLDKGVTWHKYTEPIKIEKDITIRYYAVDALGNKGTEQTLNVIVIVDKAIIVAGVIFGVVAITLIITLILVRKEYKVKNKKRKQLRSCGKKQANILSASRKWNVIIKPPRLRRGRSLQDS